MKLNNIQNKLNELWAGIINFYEFNILKHSIALNITVIENGKKTEYNIIFMGVSSLHFYEDSKEKRLNPLDPDEGDYLELTSIQFYKDGIGSIFIKSSDEKWAEQYYSNSNFVLEIWNSMVLIEANDLIINDVKYDITYPNY